MLTRRQFLEDSILTATAALAGPALAASAAESKKSSANERLSIAVIGTGIRGPVHAGAFAGRGDCDGCLLFPTFVAVDTLGRVFVSNTLNGRVEVFDVDGNFVKRIGERGTGFGMFDKPKGVAVDSFGNVYVVDSGWSNVQIFNEKGEVLLYFGGRGTYPGLLANPTGISIDKQNRVLRCEFVGGNLDDFAIVSHQAVYLAFDIGCLGVHAAGDADVVDQPKCLRRRR